MSAGAFYTGQPLAKTARLTTGDNSRTAPITVSTIFDPAGIGSGAGAVQRLTVMPLATTTASCIRIWRHDGAGYHLLFEIPLPAQPLTASGAAGSIEQSAWNYPNRFPIMCAIGDTICASVNDTQTGLDVTAQGGAG